MSLRQTLCVNPKHSFRNTIDILLQDRSQHRGNDKGKEVVNEEQPSQGERAEGDEEKGGEREEVVEEGVTEGGE